MKKILKFSFITLFGFSLLLVILCVSCENNVDSEQIAQDPGFPSMEHINFSIDDNVMHFETIEDFDEMSLYISQLPNSLLDELENKLCFYSLRNYCDENNIGYPYDDKLIGITLNPMNSVEIGNYLIQFSFVDESVIVKAKNDNAINSLCRIYSFEEDIADILFFNGENTKKAVAGSCTTGTKAEGTFELYNADVDWEINYLYVPFYYRVKAKMSKPMFRPGIELTVYCGDTYMPSGYESTWMKSDELCQTGRNDIDEDERVVEVIMVQNSTKLYGFRLYALFEARDGYVPEPNLHSTYSVGLCNTTQLDDCD